MALFLAGSNQKATISVSNPNNVSLTVAMDLVVGATRTLLTRGSATGNIPAKGTGAFSVTVPMPTVAGDYPLSFWLDYDGLTAKYDLKDIIQIFTFTQVVARLAWSAVSGRKPPLEAGENVRFDFELQNLNPYSITVNNLIIKVGSSVTAPKSLTIPANSTIPSSATLTLPPPIGREWPISFSWDGLSLPISFPAIPAILLPMLDVTGMAGVREPGANLLVGWKFTNPNLVESIVIIGQFSLAAQNPNSRLEWPLSVQGIGVVGDVVLAPGKSYSNSGSLAVPSGVTNQIYPQLTATFWWRTETETWADKRLAVQLLPGTLQIGGLLAPTVTIGL